MLIENDPESRYLLLLKEVAYSVYVCCRSLMSRLSLGTATTMVNWMWKDMVLSDNARPLTFKKVSVCAVKFECQWSIVRQCELSNKYFLVLHGR